LLSISSKTGRAKVLIIPVSEFMELLLFFKIVFMISLELLTVNVTEVVSTGGHGNVEVRHRHDTSIV